MVLPFFCPGYVDSVIRGFGRGEEPSGANVPRLIQNPLETRVWKNPASFVKQENRNPESPIPVPKTRSAFHFARTTKRFPSPRCASAIQIVRPLESTAETQPNLQQRFLRLSAMISQYFI